jgi:MYXO-CTERM domain-containing protein
MATGGLALIGLGGLLLLVSRRRRNATGELR